MSKKIKTLVIIAAVVSVFVGGTVVLAASGNLGTTESAWLDFHKVMQKEMVLKGNLTQQEADEHLAKMQERFENSEDDEIYSRFSKREGKPEGRSGFGMKGRSGIIEDYAEISGKEPEEIIEELKNGGKNIWEIAEEDGKFYELKVSVLANIDEKIKDLKEEKLLEGLKEHRDEIADMKSAADAPDMRKGPKGPGGFKNFGGEKAE